MTDRSIQYFILKFDRCRAFDDDCFTYSKLAKTRNKPNNCTCKDIKIPVLRGSEFLTVWLKLNNEHALITIRYKGQSEPSVWSVKTHMY